MPDFFFAMKVYHIPKKDTYAFGYQQLLLSEEQDKLSSYLGFLNDLSQFQKQIDLKKVQYPAEIRQDLAEVLEKNYKERKLPKAKAAIELLKKPTTFTVTTGHQLCLFTGPSYFVYKILHTIKLARKLKETYPTYDFIPVYWMASEDHDVEEIRSLHLFNNSIQWEQELSGAVGELKLNGLAQAISKLQAFFRAEIVEELMEISDDKNQATYGSYVFDFVTQLFHDFELIVLNPQQESLKKHFISIANKELETQFSFHAVTETNQAMEKEGFHQQINPREVNLFHLMDGNRQRIVAKENGFSIGEKLYSKDELISAFHSSPLTCSPNVVLRPVYQEKILPNLAYVGGAGELSYWVQLKRVFETCQVPYPILQMRKSFQVIDEKSLNRWLDLGFSVTDLFKSKTELVNSFTELKMKEEISFHSALEAYKNLEKELYSVGKTGGNDIEKWIGAELTKMEKQILQIEQKLKKTIKQKHEEQIGWIEKQKERLFPGGNLQERHVNFFHFCADGKINDRLHLFLNQLDPFDASLVLLVI
ncbi:MAG: hypothetical protein RL037_768 [Bacteroidota bacterium]